MTNPGEDAPRTSSSDPDGGASEPMSAGYEAPPIEQGTPQESTPPGDYPAFEPPAPPFEQPGYPPPAYGASYQAPPAYDPTSGYPPPPPPPQGAYPPPPGSYPPPPGAYPPPYSDPSNLGQGYPPPPYGAPSPYGAPAGYGAPGYAGGYGLPAQDKTNGMAIGSLVASAVGILCGIGSLVGIVLGIVALNQINNSGEGGRGLAIAGIAVGAATFLFNIIFTFAVLGT